MTWQLGEKTAVSSRSNKYFPQPVPTLNTKHYFRIYRKAFDFFFLFSRHPRWKTSTCTRIRSPSKTDCWRPRSKWNVRRLGRTLRRKSKTCTSSWSDNGRWRWFDGARPDYAAYSKQNKNDYCSRGVSPSEPQRERRINIIVRERIWI